MVYTVSSAGPSVCHTLSGGCADTSDTHLSASVMRTSKTPQCPGVLSLTPPEYPVVSIEAGAATVLMEGASLLCGAEADGRRRAPRSRVYPALHGEFRQSDASPSPLCVDSIAVDSRHYTQGYRYHQRRFFVCNLLITFVLQVRISWKLTHYFF